MTDPRKRDDFLALVLACESKIAELRKQLSYTSESTELFRGGEEWKGHFIAGVAQEIAGLEEAIKLAGSQLA